MLYLGSEQKILLLSAWPEQVDEDTVSERVGTVGDSGQELGSPQSRDLQSHDGHQGQVDEPDEARGAEVKKELKAVLKFGSTRN